MVLERRERQPHGNLQGACRALAAAVWSIPEIELELEMTDDENDHEIDKLYVPAQLCAWQRLWGAAGAAA